MLVSSSGLEISKPDCFYVQSEFARICFVFVFYIFFPFGAFSVGFCVYTFLFFGFYFDQYHLLNCSITEFELIGFRKTRARFWLMDGVL